MSFPEHLARALSASFEVRGLLGQGASGWVVHALDKRLGREVALKVARRKGTRKQLARFEREGRIAGGLQHSNVVRTHSIGEVEGHPYLVLELVPGAETLRTTFEQAPVPTRLRALRDVAAAMAYAHEHGIVHRDLKPENVLVDGMGRARVTDFGVATMRGLERMTQSGALVGTPHYMAPEQLGGKRDEVGPHSDVWALGVMLYEAVNGARPFDGDSLFQLASHINQGAPRSDPLPGTPPAVLDLIERALSPKPAARHAHAGALLRELDAALEGERASARRPVVPWALGVVGSLLLLVAGVLVFNRVRGAADATSDPSSQAASRQPDAALRSWRRIRAGKRGAALLVAGETWLQDFPESDLVPEVQEVLVARRLAEPRRIYSDHKNRLRLASSKTLLVAADELGGVSVGGWDAPERARRQVFAPGPVFLADSPVSHGVWAAAAARELAFFGAEAAAAPPSRRQALDATPSGVCVSHDGGVLAVWSGKNTGLFRVKPVGSDAQIEKALALVQQPQPAVEGVILDDGSALALALVEPGFATLDSLRVVSLSDYSVLAQVGLPMEPTALAALPGAQFALASEMGHVLVYDRRANYLGAFKDPELLEREAPNSVAQMYDALGNDGRVHALTMGSGGLLYSVGDHGSSEESAIRVWDVATRKLLRLQVVPRAYRACCLSVDGRYLACATEAGAIEVWDRWLPDEWAP